jgi:hypothetical protein
MPDVPKGLVGWAIAVTSLLTIAMVVFLLALGTRGLTGPELSSARLDAIRTGISVGIGGGGIFALYLAWRRQQSTEIAIEQKNHDLAAVAKAYQLQERVAQDARDDASARRITDLFTKAIEQLGSDKAPVRLGGLYALERLAQDTPKQRQTIVNVLCAYLRMPYIRPGDGPNDDEWEPGDYVIDRAVNTDFQLMQKEYWERVEELEVRLAAQRVLAEHLAAKSAAGEPNPLHWDNIDLDLTGATLIDFHLVRCVVQKARFRSTLFAGEASFRAAVFAGQADFNRATFRDKAVFRSTELPPNTTSFHRTTFDMGVPDEIRPFLTTGPEDDSVASPA